MKKRLLGAMCLIYVFAVSCTDENLEAEVLPNSQELTNGLEQDLLSVQEINQQIDQSLETEGDFNWNDASDQMLWSALSHGDFILTIGYGSDVEDYANKNSNAQQNVKEALVAIVKKSEESSIKEANKDEDVLIYDDPYLTVMDLKVEKLETVKALRSDHRIRYMEPAGYAYEQQNTTGKSSGSGCGLEGENLSSQDYINIAPGARMPWNFPIHKIDQAWSYSTGSGITIGVVDTGISPSQSLLNGNFNSGYSSGRSVEKYGVYVDSFWPWSRRTDGPNDKCGHGTSMSAAATAPRNSSNLPVGVAYNANLVSYRAAANVLLNGYHEQRGVATAFTQLGNRSDVKIISMSMGYIYSIGRIKDAIRYANNRGKLIFCAGGTSTSFTNFVGVIFPANMSETVAVTGIEEGNGYDECDTCHKGSKIDFTVVMERANNNHIPVLGYSNGSSDYVGGSSVATANAAGIAALVWARNPNWSRTQVLNKLKTTADLYPNKSGSYGWGNLDALRAVQ